MTGKWYLLSGSDASIEAMTERLEMGKGHLTSLVRLSYLGPDIVRALLKGRQPIELTPTRLLRLSGSKEEIPPDIIRHAVWLYLHQENYGRVGEVMSIITAAGYKKVALVTDPNKN